MMIPSEIYEGYLSSLLRGDRGGCAARIKDLVALGTPVKEIYVDMFQRSLYQVGELWEYNRISVAMEQMATSITESLLSLLYQQIFAGPRKGRKAIVACVANEYHQLGGKMLADLLEMSGWDAYFLGANTPVLAMIKLIGEKQPDFLALSLAVYSNFGNMIDAVKEVRQTYPLLPILLGGQAFRWGGRNITRQWSDVTYIKDLDHLETHLQMRFGNQTQDGN
ncbi:MAG: cobalamin-dependent protein [Deltaproteobacteria bacterium]|nr:cobalamin-dependent protein [Deltaproteobacteria bacterium]